jgi:GNAT superfamily N-acetyltransferase
MTSYRVRPATARDHDILVGHRVRMFQDMGLDFDAAQLADAFGPWLTDMSAQGVYRAWVVESEGAVVAGGGLTILPWPPGPRYPGGRVAFVYNVYTEPAHRQRGLARRIMDAMHAWCKEEGIANVALNASRDGQPLYESMGYSITTSPMMFLALE